MRLAEKFGILASRYFTLIAVWVGYTCIWFAADQHPPYTVDVFYTVSVAIGLLALLNTSTMLFDHWRRNR